jgi:hypothetical protein
MIGNSIIAKYPMGKVTCLLALWSAAACFAEAPTVLAIRDARVVTVSGPTIEKATVVLRDGLIEAIGENLAIPGDAWIIDGAGLTVYPGLIDGLSTWGIPEARAAASSSPDTDVLLPISRQSH